MSSSTRRRPTVDFRSALVYGLGRSGIAAARLLSRHGVRTFAVDDRQGVVLPEDLAGVEWVSATGPLPIVDVVVTSPGVPEERALLDQARRSGVPVMAELELAALLAAGPLLAITGSNGKSTTTELLGRLLRGAGVAAEVCGNIGTPLSEVVPGLPGRAFVVEVSSFQLMACDSLRPQVAALLNLSPDHLDRHRSMAGYLAAKTRLFANQVPGDVAILPAADAKLRDLALPPGVRRRLFSALAVPEDGAGVLAQRVVEALPGGVQRVLFELSDLQLEGTHNLENAVAAALMAVSFGADPQSFGETLRQFPGLPHRMQRIGDRCGVAFYDDSKGTNVGATEKSLLGFPDHSVHLILGGQLKGADPAPLVPVVARKARRVYLIGEATEVFAAALGPTVAFERCGDLATALRSAANRASQGETVLLSPACASFDQFRDYADRGDTFRRLVEELGNPKRDGEPAAGVYPANGGQHG